MAESKHALEVVREITASGRTAPLPPGVPAADVLEAAANQGVAGLLLAAIERDHPSWAEPLVPRLAEGRRGTLVRTLGQIDLGRQVLSLLDEHGIRALPLKGVVLAETLYDVESDRPMSDVDVLALERWSDGVAALLEDGFVVIDRGDHAWAFRDPRRGEIVELHRSVTSCPGLFPLDADAVWARRRSGRGQLPRLPSPEDLLVQLALHGAFQHALVLSLVQWLDFRRILEREVIDPVRLRDAVSESRAGEPLRVALAVAERVVGAAIPAALAEVLLEEGADPRRAPRWIEPRLATPLAFVAPTEPDHVRVRWELVSGPVRRAELVWRTLFLPEDEHAPASGSRLGKALRRAVRLAGVALGRWRRTPAPQKRAEAPDPAERTSTTPSVKDAPEVPFREELLRECLSSFPWVRLTVRGQCMQPSLDDGEKVRLVSSRLRPPRLGDIVLARGHEGLRLHRLVWGPPIPAGRRWRMKADRGVLFDPPLDPHDVLATVVGVEGRPDARPHRPGLALLSLVRGVLYRLRPRTRSHDAEAVP